MRPRLVALCATALTLAAFPAMAGAHPIEAGEQYIPFTAFVGEERAQSLVRGGAAAQAAPAGPSVDDMSLEGNSDKDGTTNSDLAFNGNLAYAGNYGGFRILDIRRGGDPREVVDFPCNGPQNDVSFWETGRKTFLFQSIDTGQDREDCSSVNAPIVGGSRVGYEGVRVFDVTNPSRPVFLDMIQTACGSHTHSLLPGDVRRGDDDDDDDDDDGRRGRGNDDKAYIYVSSYPLGSGITPPDAQGPGEFKPCSTPHQKISIIEVSAPKGNFRYRLKEQPLASDTTPYRGGLGGTPFIACHDIQFLLEKEIALGSCAGDSQLWDVSDPWDPSTEDGDRHTHFRRPADSTAREYEFMHSGVFTWDGRYLATMDETGGGVEPRCFGDASTDGFYYFYRVVRPGSPHNVTEELSKYTIPRAQTPEQPCVSHNATVIPVDDRYLLSAAYYTGGVSIVDFSDVRRPREVGHADVEDAVGLSDEWSSYWYNGRVYSNSGLGRRGATQNRGVDVWRLTGDLSWVSREAERWKWSNPQTQEESQAP